MEKERTLTCDCGKILVSTQKEFNVLFCEAMVCPACGFTTLTKEQAERLLRLKEFESILSQERKVIKIGNSMGLTLPDRLKEVGIHIGQKVKIEPVSDHSLNLVFK